MQYGKRIALVILFLVCSTSWAAVPETPGEGEAAGPVVTCRVQSINMQRSYTFDDSGEIRHTMEVCHLSIYLLGEEKDHILGYSELTFDDPVLDTGDKLTPKTPAMRPVTPRSSGGQSKAFVSAQFTHPPVGASAIAEIRGSVMVTQADGAEKTAALPAIKDIVGKTIRIEDALAGTGAMKVTKEYERVAIEMASDAWLQCSKIEAVKVDGSRVNVSYSPNNISDTATKCRFNSRLPDDARIVMTFVDKVKTTKVHFVLENIPLSPRAPAAARGEDVIRIKAVEKPVEVEEALPDGGEALKVIVR